jgi:hypothetical protein
MSNQEPIYQYKRGEGWVIGPLGKVHEYSDTKEKFTIEVRMPSPGEKFLWSVNNRTPEWWKEHLDNCPYNTYHVDIYPSGDISVFDGAKSFCVLVPYGE